MFNKRWEFKLFVFFFNVFSRVNECCSVQLHSTSALTITAPPTVLPSCQLNLLFLSPLEWYFTRVRCTSVDHLFYPGTVWNKNKKSYRVTYCARHRRFNGNERCARERFEVEWTSPKVVNSCSLRLFTGPLKCAGNRHWKKKRKTEQMWRQAR